MEDPAVGTNIFNFSRIASLYAFGLFYKKLIH